MVSPFPGSHRLPAVSASAIAAAALVARLTGRSLWKAHASGLGRSLTCAGTTRAGIVDGAVITIATRVGVVVCGFATCDGIAVVIATGIAVVAENDVVVADSANA